MFINFAAQIHFDDDSTFREKWKRSVVCQTGETIRRQKRNIKALVEITTFYESNTTEKIELPP